VATVTDGGFLPFCHKFTTDPSHSVLQTKQKPPQPQHRTGSLHSRDRINLAKLSLSRFYLVYTQSLHSAHAQTLIR